MNAITTKIEKKKWVHYIRTSFLVEGEIEVAELQHTQVPVNGVTHAHVARVFSLSNFLLQTDFYNNVDKLLATFR
jgi:hypothetical protein